MGPKSLVGTSWGIYIPGNRYYDIAADLARSRIRTDFYKGSTCRGVGVSILYFF